MMRNENGHSTSEKDISKNILETELLHLLRIHESNVKVCEIIGICLLNQIFRCNNWNKALHSVYFYDAAAVVAAADAFALNCGHL